MIELVYPYASILPPIGAVSAAIFVTSLVSLPWLAARIPENYFLHNNRVTTKRLANTHPVFQFFFILIKNFLGFILLAGGFMMLFIPGQGLLTIFMGLILIDYPKKYAFERKLVKTPAVLKSLNWLRKKANQPPLNVGE